MEDIFKKLQEIDGKGVDRTDVSFSSDLNKFNEACVEFIDFIKQSIENANDNEVYFLYVFRNGNSIDYGKYRQGIRMKKDTIEMISNEDLKKLYELLQAEFASNFKDGCKHIFGEEWSLNPMIGENIMIDINSYNSYDKNWFYEEAHKEQKSGSPKKR